MSSRLACWLQGHAWGKATGIQEDLFGNEWRISTCMQCGARRRQLHRAWDAR